MSVMVEINVSSLEGTGPRFWEGKTGECSAVAEVPHSQFLTANFSK